MRKQLLFAGLLVLALSSARAALTWENPVVDLHPSIEDETAVAKFKYKNTGDKPVKITAVRPSCGCTTAAPPAEAIAPGKSGEITATFHIGDRVGPQTKMIHVSTDAPDDNNMVLTLHADVPKVLEVKPTFLYWPRTAPVEPKKIEVTVENNFPVKNLNLTCTDPAVKAVAKPLPNEKGFEITIDPPSGNRPINASLTINSNFPKAKPKLYYAYLRIDAHPAAGGASPAPVAAASATPSPSAAPAATP